MNCVMLVYNAIMVMPGTTPLPPKEVRGGLGLGLGVASAPLTGFHGAWYCLCRMRRAQSSHLQPAQCVRQPSLPTLTGCTPSLETPCIVTLTFCSVPLVPSCR